MYGSIIQDKINHDLDLAQAVGRIVYTTQAIVEKAADQVGGGPFGCARLGAEDGAGAGQGAARAA